MSLPEINSSKDKELKKELVRSLSNEKLDKRSFDKRKSNYQQYEQMATDERDAGSDRGSDNRSRLTRNELDMISTI